MARLNATFALLTTFLLTCGHGGRSMAPVAKPGADPCAAEVGPADRVLRNFRERLLALAATEPASLTDTL